MPILTLSNFGGGLNLRAAPSELALNETPACLNVTLDERGGVVKRLGLSRLNTSDGAAGGYLNLYYSPVLGIYLLQDGTSLYKTTDFNTLTLVASGFSSTARLGFCDFTNKVVVVHPLQGVWYYDGATWTSVSATVKGSTVAAWQNKLWVGGDPAQPPRLYFSAQGVIDFTSTGSGLIDLREIDSQIITALEVTSYLIAYKADSAYRVYDRDTGNYVSISATAGASGNLASTVAGKTIASMNGEGIWVTDGLSAPANVAEKVKPLFSKAQMNPAKLDLIAAAKGPNRIAFSFPYGASQTLNNRTLEYHPREGWIVVHSFGCSAFTNPPPQLTLYGADPAKKNVYEVFRGGSDNGAAISATFQTPWIVPSAGSLVRLIRLEPKKRGAFTLYLKRDYDSGQGQAFSISAPALGTNWDGGRSWDDVGSFWGQTNYEEKQQLFPYALAEAVSFNVAETSSQVALGPNLLGDGAAPETGAFALYALSLDVVGAGIK